MGWRTGHLGVLLYELLKDMADRSLCRVARLCRDAFYSLDSITQISVKGRFRNCSLLCARKTQPINFVAFNADQRIREGVPVMNIVTRTYMPLEDFCGGAIEGGTIVSAARRKKGPCWGLFFWAEDGF